MHPYFKNWSIIWCTTPPWPTFELTQANQRHLQGGKRADVSAAAVYLCYVWLFFFFTTCGLIQIAFNRCTSWCANAGSNCPRGESPSSGWSRSWPTCSNSSSRKTIFKPLKVFDDLGVKLTLLADLGPDAEQQNWPQISICFVQLYSTERQSWRSVTQSHAPS